MRAAIKRLAVCWWFHRWHQASYGGWSRHFCQACETRDFGGDRKERSLLS